MRSYPTSMQIVGYRHLSVDLGPKRGERAAIILALIVGLQLFRKVIGNKALADANSTSLSGDLKLMLERLIDISACTESPRNH